MDNKVPGLISISETSNGFVFEIEDDKVAEFYSAFGLEVGDVAGFQTVFEEAVRNFLEQHGRGDQNERTE